MAATWKTARECTLFCLSDDTIDYNTFDLLYDLRQLYDNLDFRYEVYEPFCLDNLSDDQCKNEFRYFKNEIFRVKEIVRIPEKISCANRVKIDSTEAFCMFLKRFSYAC